MRLIDADKLKTSLNETVDAAIKWHEDCLGEIMQNRSEAAITAFIECILRVEEQLTIDAVEVVRCKDCKHRPIKVREKNGNWLALPPRILDSELEYADDYACPCLNRDDYYYSRNPDLNWYCPNGERREDGRSD